LSENRHFLIDSENLFEDVFILNGQEGHHAARVTHVKKGDSITLLKGNGFAYSAIVDEVAGDRIKGHITKIIEDYNEPYIKIHLGIGILKGVKLDTVVEKCTELGVYSISILNLKNSVKKNTKLDRLESVSLAAIKQCGRGLKPSIRSCSLENWIGGSSGNARFIFHNGNNSKPFVNIFPSSINNENSIWIGIGPEGGFSKEELDALEKVSFKMVSLGQRRLRSETAAITSVGLIEQLII
tara:strand:- start:16350 stop:17069 length:720 start_codon:yes stop_codon:yes gene_type:complete